MADESTQSLAPTIEDKLRAENAALRHQVLVLHRDVTIRELRLLEHQIEKASHVIADLRDAFEKKYGTSDIGMP